MMSVWNKILLWYQNSDKILLRKQNSKQNFDFETRGGVGHDVCMKQNSAVEYQNSDKILLENKILSRILISRQGEV